MPKRNKTRDQRRNAIQQERLKNILAKLSDELLYIEAGDPAVIEAADSDVPSFDMLAYSGGELHVGFGWPVIVDLAGMEVDSPEKPILKEHDRTAVVGHSPRS